MFTEEEINKLKKTFLDDGDIHYLEKRIDNSRTENELKFWTKMYSVFTSEDPLDGDYFYLYKDDVVEIQLFAFTTFYVYIKNKDGENEFTEYYLEWTMTLEHDFNGKIMTLEQYLDDVVHWDYDCQWMDEWEDKSNTIN